MYNDYRGISDLLHLLSPLLSFFFVTLQPPSLVIISPLFLVPARSFSSCHFALFSYFAIASLLLFPFASLRALPLSCHCAAFPSLVIASLRRRRGNLSFAFPQVLSLRAPRSGAWQSLFWGSPIRIRYQRLPRQGKKRPSSQ